MKAAASQLITKLLGSSILFEHDPDELSIWINCIPEAPPLQEVGGAPAVDEAKCVISFLGRIYPKLSKGSLSLRRGSLKHGTGSFRRRRSGSREVSTPDYRSLPSPLLLTVVGDIRDALATPQSAESTLALPPMFTYLRSLILLLVGKQRDLKLARFLCEKMKEMLSQVTTQVPLVIRRSFEKEVSLLELSLEQLLSPKKHRRPLLGPSLGAASLTWSKEFLVSERWNSLCRL